MKNRIEHIRQTIKQSPEMPMEMVDFYLEPELISLIEGVSAELGEDPHILAGKVLSNSNYLQQLIRERAQVAPQNQSTWLNIALLALGIFAIEAAALWFGWMILWLYILNHI